MSTSSLVRLAKAHWWCLLAAMVGPSTALAQNPRDLSLANGSAVNSLIGFTLPLPPGFVLDSSRQQALSYLAGKGFVWPLVDTTSRDAMSISAGGFGAATIDEASWRWHAEHTLRAQLGRYPGANVISRSIDWRADTATYRWAYLDVLRGHYHKTVCKGSNVERVQAAVVCVSTVSAKADLYEDVLNGLELIRPKLSLLRRSKR